MDREKVELSHEKKSVIAGLLSYMAWGLFPIYWKLLKNVPNVEILAHRMIWAFLFYFAIYAYRANKRGNFSLLLKQGTKQWMAAGLAAAILTLNWAIYIYAVKSGQIVQGSLAYFINPLLNVAVGVLFFKESFPTILKISCFLAGIGVLIQVLFANSFPWISLSLALTFCTYGVIKKRLRTSADLSSTMEGFVSVFPALILAFYFRSHSEIVIAKHEWLLLVGSGVVTGLPLLLFSSAAQKLPYSLLGMMQFIAPSLQFLVGTAWYGETLDTAGMISFGLIWSGAGFYFWHMLKSMMMQKRLDA